MTLAERRGGKKKEIDRRQKAGKKEEEEKEELLLGYSEHARRRQPCQWYVIPGGPLIRTNRRRVLGMMLCEKVR